MKNIPVTNTDEYIAGFPKDMQKTLKAVRTAIRKVAPHAEEVISYNMPAHKINEILVWYAACKTHIGFYPTSGPIRFFKAELAPYKTSKGAIQFPLDKPMPLKLITKIVELRLKADQAKSAVKIKKDLKIKHTRI